MTLSGALRDPPLVAALVLTGLALFFGGGSGDGSLWWLGGDAAVAIVVALLTRGLPRGLSTLAPLAVLGLWLASRTRELALGLCLLLGAVAVWALAAKVFPPLYDYGAPEPTRL